MTYALEDIKLIKDLDVAFYFIFRTNIQFNDIPGYFRIACLDPYYTLQHLHEPLCTIILRQGVCWLVQYKILQLRESCDPVQD